MQKPKAIEAVFRRKPAYDAREKGKGEVNKTLEAIISVEKDLQNAIARLPREGKAMSDVRDAVATKEAKMAIDLSKDNIG